MMGYFKDLVRIVVVFAVYFATAKWGLSLDAVSGFATFVWPPSGIAVAAVLLWGWRIVPGITLAAFLVNLTTGAPPLAAFLIGIGNTLEAVVAVYLLRRFGSFENSLLRLRDVFALVILACTFATTVAATVGTTSLYLAGTVASPLYLKTWLAWWIGDALGILIVTPFLLVWSKPLKVGGIFESNGRIFQAILAFSPLVLANLFVFYNKLIPVFKNAPIGYTIFPFVLWIAAGYGMRGVTLSTLITSAFAIWGTSLGYGVFVRETFADSLFFVQLFMFTISLIGLTLAAVVSEKKRYQEELIRAREDLEDKVRLATSDLQKFKLAVENAHDSIVITDTAGSIVYANKAMERITGFASVDVIGQKVGTKNLWGGQMAKAFYKAMWDIIKSKKIFRNEITNKRKNGERYRADLTIIPLVDNSGEVKFYLEAQRDITEQKRSEELRWEQLRHETELENKELDFIAMASHELQTPLALIKGYMSMLVSGKYGKIDSQAKGYILESLSGTDRMAKLVKNLLSTSRIDRAKVKIEKKTFDLSELVGGVVRGFEDIATEKGLALDFEEGVNIKVDSDLDKCVEIVANLIDNAIKYTEQGNVSVSVSKEGSFARVVVGDTGIGIKKNILPHIFDKFYFSESFVSKQSESTGLGLYIVKSLVGLLGGTIQVESRDGVGSKFTFMLPLAKRSLR